MARIASFTSAGTPTGPRSTLAELMAKKKMLAEQQGDILAPRPIESWTQGAAQLAQTFVNAMQQRRASAEEATGREQLAGAMAGIDWDKGATPEQLATIQQYDPELGMKVISDMVQARRAAVKTLTPEEEIAEFGAERPGTYQRKGTGDITLVDEPAVPEQWVDIPAPQGETGQWQQSTKTGEKMRRGASGTNITVNPPSAETSAKLGLAQGFLDNYDSILKSVDAGEMTGGGFISGVQLGRGNGGTQYRNLKQGTEALIRILTGAGMSENEAVERAQQYEPQVTDDAPTLRSKVQGLKQAIDNVIQGVQTRGQPGAAAGGGGSGGGTATTGGTDTGGGGGTTSPAGGDLPIIDPKDMETYRKLPDGAQYKLPGDETIYTKKPKGGQTGG
jgi:hypothetical protein